MAGITLWSVAGLVQAQAVSPSVTDSNLAVRTVASGFTTPVALAFLAPNDMFVLEKNTGRVQRVVDGNVSATVLDLAVNFASERGLLGIALHPRFPSNPAVYLYWTESTIGTDTNVFADTPLLGNRVDRYLWDGTTLAFDRTLIKLRALQADAEQPERGNHNGGVIRFGPDPRLEDRVADNRFKFDLTESESLLFGSDFGVVTDIQTSPSGELVLVSLSRGEIYAIHRR